MEKLKQLIIKVLEEENNQEEMKNVVGLFEILLKVDKRTNPHLYEANKETHNKRREEIEEYN